MPDCRCGGRRYRARGRDRGRRAHERGLVGHRAREGAESPARARRALRAARARGERRDQVLPAGTFSGPIRSSSRARIAATKPTAIVCFAGEVNNLPSTVGGGGFHADGKLPRFRAVDFKARSELGPIDGVRHRRLARRLRRDGAVLRRSREAHRRGRAARARTRSRSGAAASTRCRPGADMFGAVLTTEAATRLGYHPYVAPTGVNSVPYDGRPACNNCGFCGHYGCPIEAKGDPSGPAAQRVAHGPLRDPAGVDRRTRAARRGGQAGTRCAVPRRRRQRARGERARRGGRGRGVGDAAPDFAVRRRELVRDSSAVTSCTTSRRS